MSPRLCLSRGIPTRIPTHSRYLSSWSDPPASKSRIFSGIQPTGIPHLGNYLGALRPWVGLQNKRSEESPKPCFCIVDLHALTATPSRDALRQWRKETYISLLAVGLNNKKSIVFQQTDVPAHTELMWILSTVASTGYLSRMTQWKSKLGLGEDATFATASARSNLRLGLFSYPVLQAADILLYRADKVPVGEDQAQHIEFARSLANSFNNTYGNYFSLPEAIICMWFYHEREDIADS